MNVSEWPKWESIVIRQPLLTLMLAMIAPGSVGRNAAQAEGLAGDATLSEEMLNTPGCMRSISPVLLKVQTFRQRRIASGAKAIFAAFALFAASTRSARAEDAGSSFLTQPSLTDTPDGPKEQLRSIGIMPDFWVTQFYQGQTEGDGSKTWRYGGKVDAFLRVDAEKLGLWPGFHVNAQYEHYFGQNINRTDFALIPVNTALAYAGCQETGLALQDDCLEEPASVEVSIRFVDARNDCGVDLEAVADKVEPRIGWTITGAAWHQLLKSHCIVLLNVTRR